MGKLKLSILPGQRRINVNLVLGITVRQNALHGVLMQKKGGAFHVLKQFVRQRSADYESHAFDRSPAAIPAMSGGEEDFSISMSEGGGQDFGNLFLQSEFEGVDPAAVETDDFDAISATDSFSEDDRGSKTGPSTFQLELRDMLDECRDLGYKNVALAFCVDSSTVEYQEIRYDSQLAGGRKSKKQETAKEERKESVDLDRSKLLQLLKEQHDNKVKSDRIGFIALSPNEFGTRYLAIVPEDDEPVSPSIEILQSQLGAETPSIRVMDAEVPVLTGLARSTYALQPDINTVIVRVSAADTLAIFMKGEQLVGQEHLRSLTTFDPPATVCSRILLQQDELGIEAIHHVVVLADERKEDLLAGFMMFYPEAQVSSFEEGLNEYGLSADRINLGGVSIPAIGVGMRLLQSNQRTQFFEDINLLPAKLQRRTVRLSVAWHTIAAAALLFICVLFFMARYFHQQSTISQYEQRMAEYPATLAMTATELQAEIETLQATATAHAQALAVLDSLLIGTDRWSRVLDKTSSETRAVTGIWIDTWQPNPNARDIRIQGNATDRDQVVRLAERLDASIELLTFSEIREWPVYHYSLMVPAPERLPEAATYLREQAIGEEQLLPTSN